MEQTHTVQDRIVLVTEAMQRTGLSRASLHRLAKARKFPTPRQLSAHRIGWLDSEIAAWLRSRETPVAYRSAPAAMAAKS
jgi:prophage regulatory protein